MLTCTETKDAQLKSVPSGKNEGLLEKRQYQTWIENATATKNDECVMEAREKT